MMKILSELYGNILNLRIKSLRDNTKPTEDKYSMAPLYIKGFLPQQSGGAIMLPMEITTLSGSDFDVDKLYVMIPEFRIVNHDFKRARLDFNNAYSGASKLLNQILGSLEDVNESAEFGEFMKLFGDRYLLDEPVIEKVRYNHNKAPHENSLAARNNLLIDMMWGILTNEDTASKILNPGGFDYLKKAARIITILLNATESELRKELNLLPNESIFLKLLSMSLDNTQTIDNEGTTNSIIGLDGLANRYRPKLDITNPTTQIALHLLNMTAAKLIGIFANHNANHALMLHTLLGISEENGAFWLNGKILTSLHSITNQEGEYISRNNAGYLAASVDAVKDPVLNFMNLNTFTADVSMLLSRAGYNPIEVGLLLSLPIVMEITLNFFRQSKLGISKEVIIEEVLNKYNTLALLMNDNSYNNYRNRRFLAEELAKSILLEKVMPSITDPSLSSDRDVVEYYSNLAAVGYLFLRIYKTAETLGLLVSATRADTLGGGAGPTIADTLLKLLRIQDFLQSIELDLTFALTNADVIRDVGGDMSPSELRELFNNSPLPFLLAFYTLGVKLTSKLLGNYFPLYTDSFKEVIDLIRKNTKTGRLDVLTMNSVYNDLLTYIMSNTDFFGNELVGEDIVTSKLKRLEFINNFPNEFLNTIMNNPEIAELEFIKRLRVLKASKFNPVDTIIFKNVGQLSPILRERYMRDWQSLLYMGPEGLKLAMNLFRYSFYRNGFAFGPSTFVHLAPVVVRLSVPGYKEAILDILTSDADYKAFVNLYMYNHLDNRKLVPEIRKSNDSEFLTEEKEPVLEITFYLELDKRPVRSRNSNGDLSLNEYFAVRYKNGFVYYRMNEFGTDNTQSYTLITPLGYKNSFLEYEYGRDVRGIESVITKNYLLLDTTNDNVAILYQEGPSDSEIANYDIVNSGLLEAYQMDALNSAAHLIFGINLEENTGNNTKTLNDYSANDLFRDANLEEIC